jgi:hypothetical protein
VSVLADSDFAAQNVEVMYLQWLVWQWLLSGASNATGNGIWFRVKKKVCPSFVGNGKTSRTVKKKHVCAIVLEFPGCVP